MARPGILGDVFSGRVRYDTADDRNRKKLVWLFLIALLQLILIGTAGGSLISKQAKMAQTSGRVVMIRKSGGKSSSKRATVEYYVNSERFRKEFSCDSKTKVGDYMRLCYSPDYPEKAEKKNEYGFFYVLFCLFQLWIMFRTGIPEHLCAVLSKHRRCSPDRSRKKKREADPWKGWRD